ncbi:MAG TPA: hypothetical protein VGG89_10830 [Candidatus Baltobacteraceae bacterium]|jgi:hypothetical protein
MPSAYFAAACLLLGVLVVLGLQPVLDRGRSPVRSRLSPAWLFLVSATAAIFAWRWPAISVREQFNVDESLMLATAHLASVRPVPWRDFDAMTMGPVDIWPLTAMHALGFGYTWWTARILAAAVACAAVVVFYFAVRRLFGEAAARLSATFAAIFFMASSTYMNFAHYSSETIPVLLIVIFGFAIAGLVKTPGRQALVFCALAGAAAACAPFAKVQSLPIDAALTLVTLAALAFGSGTAREKAIRFAVFAAAGLLVLSAILAPVILAGGWNDFAISYVREPLWYIRQGVAIPPITRGPIDLFAMFPVRCLLLSVGVLVAALLAVYLLQRRSSGKASREGEYAALAIALTAAMSFYAALAPDEPFPHHLLLVVFPWCALAGAVYALAAAGGFRGFSRGAAIVATVAFAVSGAYYAIVGGPVLAYLGLHEWTTGTIRIGSTPWNPREVAVLREVPRGSSIAIWGWEPGVFVVTGALPGTREAASQFQMWPGPYREYYIDRYVADLKSNRPEFFLNAVGPLENGLWTPPQEYQLRNAPAVADYVAKYYRLVAREGNLKLYRLTTSYESGVHNRPANLSSVTTVGALGGLSGPNSGV